jgi:hypothetical protein
MVKKKFILLFLRYLTLLVLILLLPYFSVLLSPITIKCSSFLLSLFYNVKIVNNMLLINDFMIKLVPACIASSAYFLLISLNFATPIKFVYRIYSLAFLVFSFFLFNILRIFLFSVLYLNEFRWFDLTHTVFWYILSTFIVVCIWFLNVKLFHLKKVPFYSDILFLKKLIK